MSFIDKYFIKFTSKLIGKDQYGNEYYLGKRKDFFGRLKRYVIYNGIEETSKVPPLWHAWLHYMIDETPKIINNHVWQSNHLPNLTGTKHAYDSAAKSEEMLKTFKSWQPK